MKFKLHANSDSDIFLNCDSCGNKNFDLVPEKKLSQDEKYEHFLFFECPHCAGSGFWTHRKTVDEKRNFALAIARCKSAASSAATTVEV